MERNSGLEPLSLVLTTSAFSPVKPIPHLCQQGRIPRTVSADFSVLAGISTTVSQLVSSFFPLLTSIIVLRPIGTVIALLVVALVPSDFPMPIERIGICVLAVVFASAAYLVFIHTPLTSTGSHALNCHRSRCFLQHTY